ncbi:MAG TPA: glycosyltransferase family A protein [Thermoanaerobaculia bacterium]|jgi:glycosyltransferase involved in cell wall biosynthesis|nr:glycosyltransferase family A protein [Thermoanaerobaculia bacterium]
MAEHPLVSTIIPVFNRPAMLVEAVESVLAQTYRPIEIIIIDDGSTDETAAAAETLSVRHEGIVRAMHIVNGGPGRAREAGRLAARGHYIQHLDSDDLLLPRKFALQVAALEASPQCGAAYGWTRFRHHDGRIEARPWKRSGERIETMFPSMLTMRWWDTPTPLYRASLIAAAGPWTDLRIEEDWEYDCRLAAGGVRLTSCQEWVCEVREHAPGQPTPATMRDRARAHALVFAHARHAGLDPTSPEFRQFARELFHIARQCGAAGLIDESKQLLALAREIDDARDLRAYRFLAGSVGWQLAGRAAAWLDRLRSASS